MARLAELVRDPAKQHPEKTEPDAVNHTVDYTFRVDGLKEVQVTVHDGNAARWELLVSAPDLTIEVLSEGKPTRITSCKKQAVWYRADGGPFKGSYGMKMSGDDATWMLSSEAEMRAEWEREKTTGLLPAASSIEEYLDLNCR